MTTNIGRGAALTSSDLTDGAVFDDIAVMAELGFDHLRVTVPWRRLQPKAASWDGDIVEHVRHVCAVSRERGLAPWINLLEPAVPNWFDDEGGFTDPATAGRWWPRYVERAAGWFGDVVDGWVPFEAPFAMAGRLVPNDPRKHGETMDTLVVAWRDAWRILAGGPPVAASIDVKIVRPDDGGEARRENAAASQQAIDAAKREDDLRWRLWLLGLRDGIVSIPGRSDRRLPDLAGACDVLGIATRSDVETNLYRLAEMGPDRPLAVTFRPAGANDRERSDAIDAMWTQVRRSAEELDLRRVTVTPFADSLSDDGTSGDGIVTRVREVKDSAIRFAEG